MDYNLLSIYVIACIVQNKIWWLNNYESLWFKTRNLGFMDYVTMGVGRVLELKYGVQDIAMRINERIQL
jgi:hypothetical protein